MQRVQAALKEQLQRRNVKLENDLKEKVTKKDIAIGSYSTVSKLLYIILLL